MMKKIISILLATIMVSSVFAIVPITASAGEADSVTTGVTSGTTGDCTWSLSDDGVLTISGSGAMKDYYYNNKAPWGKKITKAIIEPGVTSIGNYALYDCTGLKSVTIPDSVTSIGGSAFYCCYGLTSVYIGNSVKSIGYYAFENCRRLTSVTIPDSVTSIGENAFYGCSGLTSVTIGNSVTSIGGYVFYGCSGLTSVTIPDSVTSIGNYAFNNCRSLTSVTIPDSVTSIGNGAFCGCTGLSSVTIGNSVTSIGNGAFDNCRSLTNVTIPDSVTSIGGNAFYGCSGLISMTIPDSVTSIGNHAFYNCTGLTSVTIPDSVTRIDNSVFHGCTGLTSVIIPDSVTSIGDSAFYYCTGLTSVSIGNSVKSIDNYAFENCTGLTSVAIPDSVTSIGYRAFYCCSSLMRVTIPDSVTSIDISAFSDCVGLTSIAVDKNNTRYDSRDNCNAIINTSSNRLIAGCQNTSIPNSVTNIGDYAFYKCSGLTSVTIPDSVTSIGYNAFYNCTGLTGVTIPNSVTSIGGWAFCGCTGLTSVTIPDSVTSIERGAFEYCTGLTSVIIPDSVKSIGEDAFYDCNNLTDVYYSGTEENWNSISVDFGNSYLLNANIHFRDKGGYKGNNAHDYSRFYHFTDSDDIWTAPHKDGTVPVEMDLGLYQDDGKSTKMDIKWSYSIFGKSSHIADNDLAIASLVLSANAYNKGRQRKTLQDLGFSDIQFYNDTGYDDINRVENVIASTVQPINGQRTNVLVIACRGSVTILQDWVSNIVQQAQGFRFAAEDIKNDLVDYIQARHIDTSIPTKILLTGHSRGAAAANILASIIPSDIAKKSDIFTYTFACPNTTNDAGRENYPIFNILNSGDFVTQLPIIYDANPRFGAYNIWFDKATAKDFNSYFTAVTGLNDVTYILDYPLSWCNGSFGQLKRYAFRHHSLALYLAFLLGEGIENYNSPHFDKKRISVECPVDVSVYDSAGQLLGTIKDNVADDALLANGIIPVIDGDKKYLYMTSNRDISLKLTGSDSGQMKYTVQDIDLNTGEVSEQGEFSSVALENGKTMTSAVASDIAVKDTQLYVADGDKVLKKVSDNGEESDVVMISFDTGAGEKLRDMAVKKGDAPGELPKATLEGYGFDGWYCDKECTEAFDETQALNESITLYAAFYQSQTAYAGFTDVSYDGSKLEAEVKFEYNRLNGQLAAVLYKDNKMLACSFTSVTDSNSTANFTFGVTGLSGLYDLKLFCINHKGQFEPAGKAKGYDISFYSDFLYSGNNYGRAADGDKAPTLVKDGNVILPENLKVSGQTFVGWYSDEAFMTKFDFDTSDIKDTTLYAKWSMGLLGDVDGDSNVEVRDATWIQRHIAQVEIPFVISKTTADVDGDGIITVMDATAIQYYLANMKTTYHIGELV